MKRNPDTPTGASSAASQPDPAQDDWDAGPPRRPVESGPAFPALNSLSGDEMTSVFIGMLNEMIGPTYNMSLAYLRVAGELAPDNPGSERKINVSCKLVALTTKVIQAVEKLKKDAG